MLSTLINSKKTTYRIEMNSKFFLSFELILIALKEVTLKNIFIVAVEAFIS